jgi:drug/metabolite transporter (DMT)-like permease
MSRVDLWLLVVTLIWGSNFAVVKSAFRELEPVAFNALRLLVASAVFLALIVGVERWRPRGEVSGWWRFFRTDVRLTRGDWLRLALIGLVGHFCYQVCFVGGLARTSVANSSLILGFTPATVTLAGVATGQERVRGRHWVGLALSIAGLYLVVGSGARFEGDALLGDALTMVAVACWTAYTLMSQRLMERHSPLAVTGLSMAIGAVLYAGFAWPTLRRTPWGSVSAGTWLALVGSAVLALCLAYLLWYVAVRVIGSARTAIYSNLTPIVAMGVAWLWLGEPVGWAKAAGAAAVLGGVALARLERRAPPLPAEE